MEKDYNPKNRFSSDPSLSRQSSYEFQLKDKNSYNIHKDLNIQNRKLCVDVQTQYDTDIYTQYLISFLHMLESQLRDGQITTVEIEGDQNNKFDLNGKINRQQRLNEMKQLLCKIRSLRCGNGDVFFLSMAKVFFAHSSVPWNHSCVVVRDSENSSPFETIGRVS